jgi:hypothetical protein
VSARATALRVGAVRRTASPAPLIFLATRAGIWIAAALTLAWFPGHGNHFGTGLWLRADSNWYTSIARHGYGADPGHTPAFFPGFPTLVAGLGRVIGNYGLAGLLISLACCAIAFELLWQLALPRLGDAGATRSVLYMALFPMAVFLGAVYSESLFLALCLAAFVLAERDHWVWASLAAGGAMLTRSVGVAVVCGLVVMAWPNVRKLGWLLLVPVVFAAFPVTLHFQAHDAWAFAHAQDNWQRHFSWAGPLGGLWDGVRALWHTTDNFSERYYLAVNIQDLLYLVPFVALLPLIWRRVGKPYAVYTAVALAVPMSWPASTGDFPLFSMPRFTLLAFPAFIAAAVLGARPWVHTTIVAASSVLLGVAVVQWTFGALA